MTKNDLKNGMVVRLKNDDLYIVVEQVHVNSFGTQYYERWVLFSLSGKGKLFSDNFSNDFKYYENHDYNIIKIYDNYYDKNFDKYGKAIWIRQEKKKVTVSQIEKMLGYSIEIVAE